MLSDGAIQAEIAKAIAVSGRPAAGNPQFLVLTANGVIAHSAGFCSYHSSFSLGRHRSKPVVYAVVPYSGARSACGSQAAATATGDPALDAATAESTRVRLDMSNDPFLTGWSGADGGEVGPAF